MLTKRTEPDVLSEFETDESGLFHARDLQAVYFPETEADVARVLSEATASGLPVTLSGAGTGINGGRVAVEGGVVLSARDLRTPLTPCGEKVTLEQFGQQYTIHVDEGAAEAVVPAGLSLELLDKMLPEALIYPPDPTELSAFCGATIATNASGARTFRYGPTRDWVLGLRVVLPNGDILAVDRGQYAAAEGALRFPGASGRWYEVPVPTYPMPQVKNAAGLHAAPDVDLVDLFIGCEGLLGMIAEARVRLAPRPQNLVSQIAFFEEETAALGFVDDMRAAGLSGAMEVLSVEFFDQNSIGFMEHPLTEGKEYTAAYVEVCGEVDELEPLLEALETHGCVEDWFAETPDDQREQKEFRHLLPEGINSYLRRQGSQKLGTDLVVPAHRFAEMLAAYHEAGERFAARFPREGKHYLMFGHIGNYHLHVNFITHTEEERQAARGLYAELARLAIEYGGTISGEHGVGKKTIQMDGKAVPYLELMYGKEGLLQIARAKKALDPALVLNVGNMVPREYLLEV